MKIEVPKDKVFFYTLSDPKTGEIKYVGKTWTSINKRIAGHVSEAKRSVSKFELGISKRKPSKLYLWINNLTKKGLKPKIDFLFEGDRDKWQVTEKELIIKFKKNGLNLVNTSSGGYGCAGIKRPEHVKRKISLSNKGKKPSLQAILASIEYNNKKVKQYTKEMEFIKEWKSSKIASEELNIHSNSISNVLCNRAKTAGGFIWTY